RRWSSGRSSTLRPSRWTCGSRWSWPYGDPAVAGQQFMPADGMKVASAPVSFGVDEIIVDDAWMPKPDEMLDWMVDIGFEGTELGPPGFLGDAKQLRDRLSTRRLQLVGAFLPQHFSRNEKADEDRA